MWAVAAGRVGLSSGFLMVNMNVGGSTQGRVIPRPLDDDWVLTGVAVG